MNLVTITNRVNRELQGTWNGRHYDIPSGESAHPELIAAAIKRQNPLMGSEDPRTGRTEYLIGVKEWGDPTTPISPEYEVRMNQTGERWNRAYLTGARPSEVVPGDNGIYSLRGIEGAGTLPLDAGFVNPSR